MNEPLDDWSFEKSEALVKELKEHADSWIHLERLAHLMIDALINGDLELEAIEDLAREAYRSVLRRGA